MCEYFVNIPTSFSASSPISKSNGCWWLPKDCLKCKLLKRNFPHIKPKPKFPFSSKKATFHPATPISKMYVKRGFLEKEMPVPAGFVMGFNPTRF